MTIKETPFLQGKLLVFQPDKGYRFGIDSVLLANFVELRKREVALEVGACQGIVSFILALRYPYAKVFALEKERLYMECLQRGIEANAFQNKIFPVLGDFKQNCFKPNSLDVVFANPPYFEVGRGRRSPNAFKEVARRDEALSLKELLQGAKALLKTKGRLYLIFTAYRTTELINLLYQHGLTPKVVRFVHSYPGDRARLVLICAQKSAGEEVIVLPPLFIYKERKGDYTEEVKEWLKG